MLFPELPALQPVPPSHSLESEALAALPPGARVCGVDEAGRGPIAGPVVAAAVALDAERIPPGINDSKRLSANRRRVLADLIRRDAAVGIGIADVGEIRCLNILGATMLAMCRAIEDLPVPVALALVDGNRVPDGSGLRCALRAVVRGDQRCVSIAAASIIAKTHRDAIMRSLARAHPGYGWERNAGYPTAEHRSALERLGANEHHRVAFAPVRRALRSARASPGAGEAGSASLNRSWEGD